MNSRKSTLPVISPETGQCRQGQIVVAVPGASNNSRAKATDIRSLQHWLLSPVRMPDFFDAAPETLIPDNLKSAVSRVCRYDPERNPSSHQLAERYQVAVISARPRKLRDKPKVEVGVQRVKRSHQTVSCYQPCRHPGARKPL